jgi:hypothetical protein
MYGWPWSGRISLACFKLLGDGARGTPASGTLRAHANLFKIFLAQAPAPVFTGPIRAISYGIAIDQLGITYLMQTRPDSDYASGRFRPVERQIQERLQLTRSWRRGA